MAEPIVPLPTSTSESVPTVATEVAPYVPPRKRRRWWIPVIVLLIVGILLVIAYIVTERFARDYAQQLVRDQVVQVLNLPKDSEVGVDLGRGSLIVQAIRGSIDTVTVEVPELRLGDISASAVLLATGVPLDSAKPVETFRVVATVSQESLAKIAGYLSASDLTQITLGNGVITVKTQFSILNLFELPVTVDLEPSAVNGAISFAPKTITVADAELSVEELRNSPEFSALAGDLLASRDFCVADQLPDALVITDVNVVGSAMVIGLNGDGTALGDPAFSQLGTCKQK